MLKVWLPGMGSNHELDRFLKPHKLFYKVAEVVKSLKSRVLVQKVYKKFFELQQLLVVQETH